MWAPYLKVIKEKAVNALNVLENGRWVLLKKVANLTRNQTHKLSKLLKINLSSVKAYLLKEDFQQFWTYKSPAWADKFLENWATRTMKSKLETMKKVAKMLRSHKELILNWFRADGQLSSGPVEGLNNKAKLAIKKAYGFKSLKYLKIALYHQLGGLVEPPLTHGFC